MLTIPSLTMKTIIVALVLCMLIDLLFRSLPSPCCAFRVCGVSCPPSLNVSILTRMIHMNRSVGIVSHAGTASIFLFFVSIWTQDIRTEAAFHWTSSRQRHRRVGGRASHAIHSESISKNSSYGRRLRIWKISPGSRANGAPRSQPGSRENVFKSV